MKFGLLMIVLLLASLLAPAAGAIYIEGAEIPNDVDPYILAASSGPVLNPTPDTGGPIKRYLSDDPNDYVLVPGNDPGMMYALGDMGTGPGTPMAISAQKAIATDMPSYVSSPPSVPAIRSLATATNTGAETVMPPDYYAPATSSKFNPFPSTDGLQHTNLAAMGYDVSKIGGIGIPMFKFPALFG